MHIVFLTVTEFACIFFNDLSCFVFVFLKKKSVGDAVLTVCILLLE